MELYTTVLIAFGLSMDAFAITVSNGMCYKNIRKKQAALTALTFGAFQAVMPVLGYFLGSTFYYAVSFLDHWIALLLLGYIGGRMLWGAIKEIRHPKCVAAKKDFTARVLLMQGVASSIDAFTVGIGFAVMRTDIVSAALLIGAITFSCCLAGAYIGKKFGGLLKQKAEIVGGAILIAIGVKIFLEHIL